MKWIVTIIIVLLYMQSCSQCDMSFEKIKDITINVREKNNLGILFHDGVARTLYARCVFEGHNKEQLMSLVIDDASGFIDRCFKYDLYNNIEYAKINKGKGYSITQDICNISINRKDKYITITNTASKDDDETFKFYYDGYDDRVTMLFCSMQEINAEALHLLFYRDKETKQVDVISIVRVKEHDAWNGFDFINGIYVLDDRQPSLAGPFIGTNKD